MRSKAKSQKGALNLKDVKNFAPTPSAAPPLGMSPGMPPAPPMIPSKPVAEKPKKVKGPSLKKRVPPMQTVGGLKKL